jgi:hypothetical protein
VSNKRRKKSQIKGEKSFSQNRRLPVWLTAWLFKAEKHEQALSTGFLAVFLRSFKKRKS